MSKLFKNVLFSCGILLLFLIPLELILRSLGKEHEKKPYIHHSDLHHVNRANYQFSDVSLENEEIGDHKVTFDHSGRRVNERIPIQKDVKEIWFLGDSFTATYELSWKNTYVGQIESQTDYSVINFGVPTLSPLLYLLQLKKSVLSDSKKPDIIFIQLYNNDVEDDARYANRANFNSLDIPIRCNGGSKFLKDVVSRLAIANTLYVAVVNFKQGFQQNEPKVDTLENPVTDYELLPVIKEDSRFIKSISQISQFLDSLEIPYYFFSIPSRYSCITGDWETHTFDKEINHILEDMSIPHISSLDSAFQEASLSNDLFYNIDWHCTIYGNKLITQEILKLIMDI